MRVLKFRAWDNKNKEWLMGYEPTKDGFSLTGECVLFGEWGHCFDQFLFEKDGKKSEDLIIQQFTGMHDDEGREIYEGDLIGGSYYCENIECFVLQVMEFNNKHGLYEWVFLKDSYMPSFIKTIVIGNIYENPELL